MLCPDASKLGYLEHEEGAKPIECHRCAIFALVVARAKLADSERLRGMAEKNERRAKDVIARLRREFE